MVCVLLQGLAKLQKTQKDVDVLVEEAKIKAVEVEKKVAGADAFAEQVSTQKGLECISHRVLPFRLYASWHTQAKVRNTALQCLTLYLHLRTVLLKA